jgi:hypothetical protein
MRSTLAPHPATAPRMSGMPKPCCVGAAPVVEIATVTMSLSGMAPRGLRWEEAGLRYGPEVVPVGYFCPVPGSVPICAM